MSTLLIVIGVLFLVVMGRMVYLQMINYSHFASLAEGNRLRFNINLDNARHAGLRISSSLLQLASHVEEGGR